MSKAKAQPKKRTSIKHLPRNNTESHGRKNRKNNKNGTPREVDQGKEGDFKGIFTAKTLSTQRKNKNKTFTTDK